MLLDYFTFLSESLYVIKIISLQILTCLEDLYIGVDCYCLTPNEQIFSSIMARTSYIRTAGDNDTIQFILN